jgi:glycosyltransferase involved in cell wall biosynthesis
MPSRAAAPEPRAPEGARVALVHDWLTGMRGGERVLEALCEIFPTADIHTLLHVRGSVSPIIEARRPRSSFVQRLPLARRYYRQYLPFFPLAIEQFDFDGYDLVVSSSHCVAKSIVRAGRSRHLCYCHSPMRYAWDQFDAYFGPARVGRLASAAMRPMMAALARWDAATAGRVDRFLANSQYVAGRIRRYYNREAAVVYPPVDTEFFRPDRNQVEPYFLVVSALVPYKRLELAVQACAAIGARLKIVGDGPERPRLARIAGPETEFLGRRGADELRSLYQRATALIQAGEEDFGMAPVESQACGRPVVALARGGALESVEDGTTGILVSEPTLGAFADALTRARSHRFDPAAMRGRALRFSRAHFAAGVREAATALLSSRRPC